jgi:hypothetical protein
MNRIASFALVGVLFLGPLPLRGADAEEERLGLGHPLMLVKHADLILAGRVQDQSHQGETQALQYNGRTWYVRWRVAKFIPDRVIKGPAEQEYQLWCQTLVDDPRQPKSKLRPSVVYLDCDSRYLVFVRKAEKDGRWQIPWNESALKLPLQAAAVDPKVSAEQQLEAEILSAMSSSEPEIAVLAMRFGAELGFKDKAFLDSLETMARNADPHVNFGAKYERIKLGLKDALQEVIKLANQEKPPDDLEALAAPISELIPSVELTPLLVQLSEVKCSPVRQRAFLALGKSRELKMVPSLAKGLYEESPDVRRRIVVALKEILGKHAEWASSVPRDNGADAEKQLFEWRKWWEANKQKFAGAK